MARLSLPLARPGVQARIGVSLIALVFALLLPAGAHAFDVASIRAARLGPARAEGSPNDAPRLGVDALAVEAYAPVPFNEHRTVLLGGVRWERRTLRRPDDASPPGVAGITALYAVSLRLALVQPLTEDWRAIVFQQPVLQTDGEHVGNEHARLEGGALFQHTFGTTQTLTLGGVYTSTLGEPSPGLYLGYTYTGEHWNVDAVVPTDLDLFYRVGKRLRVGLAAHTTGAQYRIGAPDASADTLRYAEATAALALRWHAAGPLRLDVDIGHTVWRRFEPLADGRPLEGDALEPARYAALGVALDL